MQHYCRHWSHQIGYPHFTRLFVASAFGVLFGGLNKQHSEIVKRSAYQQALSSKLPYTTWMHIGCFDQADKDNSIAGVKSQIMREMAMRGSLLQNIIH